MAHQEELSSEEIQEFFDELGIGTELEREKYRTKAEIDPESTEVICVDNVSAPPATENGSLEPSVVGENE